MIAGIGVDITEIARVDRALRRTPSLLDKVFTQNEKDYCGKKSNQAQSFALCFAAKEAVFKALNLSDKRPAWQEIELCRNEKGLPFVRLYGKTALIAEMRGIKKWHVSCSHSDTQAIVFVVAEICEVKE